MQTTEMGHERGHRLHQVRDRGLDRVGTGLRDRIPRNADLVSRSFSPRTPNQSETKMLLAGRNVAC